MSHRAVDTGSSRRSPRTALPYVVLAAALLMTALGTVYVSLSVHARDRIRFDAAVNRAQERIENRMATYTAILRATDGLFAARWPVMPKEFTDFAARLELRKNYPGVFGLGLASRFLPENRNNFTLFMQNAVGFKDFKVWPESTEDEGSAIIYLEPQDQRNVKAIGYDMYTDPTRRDAMRQARDTGEPAASGKVLLVQDADDTNPTSGFLIYVPVYTGGLQPPTLELRRRDFRGWVYCPFRSDDLFGDVFAEEANSGLEVRIYDGQTQDPGALLYQTAESRAAVAGGSPLESLRSTQIAGRDWTVVMAAGPGFFWWPVRTLPIAAGAVGLTLSASLFFLVNGQVRARLRAQRITHDLRASQGALQEAKESAETATRLKDEFLATVSHELRTPLNAILGWAQLLSTEGGTSSPEDTRQGIETILRNARVQAQLIEDLLDISRVVSGKLRLEARAVDLATVVRAAIGSVGLAAEAKGVALVDDVGAQTALIWGDPDRLQQVFWNLLANSIKFTERGGSIRVALHKDATHAQVNVIDSGLGIDTEFLPYVFERFRQADATLTRKYGGLGLGLSIVRNLIEMHGGSVSVQSEGKGRGTTFTVTLPVRAGKPPRPGGVPKGNADGKRRSSLAGVKVLVVDDDPDTREIVQHVLTSHHAEVLTAATATRALEVLRSQDVGVLVSDLAMPEEDGYELIRMVRELPPKYGGHVPAVALSALTRVEERDRALAAGFQVHLPKPVDAGALTAIVAELGRK